MATTTYYDISLRATNVIQPDNTSTKSVYFPNGLLQKTWGSEIYPVEYQYDYAGRMTNMTTWQNFNESTGEGATGAAVTKWLYDSARGWLNQKKYADNTGPAYTYTPTGRLKSRAWARGITTWYTNNNAGELTAVSYSDATPGMTNGYDRRGRITSILQGNISLAHVFDDAGNLLRETYSGGPLNGLGVTNVYDHLFRRTNVATLGYGAAYSYDEASRLQSVSTAGATSATPISVQYGYLANSPLVEQIMFATNGTTVMTTTKGYDFLNRLTNIASSAISAVASSDYSYNSAGQRSSMTNVDGSYWVYQYDSLGQVTSGKKYWSDGSAVAGQQFDYSFDDIGNRRTTWRDTRQTVYGANTLNQYATRTVPGYLNILGTASNAATVSLWSKESTALYTPTTRKGAYFRGEVPFNNATGAVWLTITNVAVISNNIRPDIVTNAIGHIFEPKSPETFGYDADGNLTNDGRWSYTWDAENRLVNMTSLSSGPTASKRKLDFSYDCAGRRVQKIVSTNNGSVYVAQATNRFAYDGWNLLATLNPQLSTINSFAWGLDLSGSEQGAGGVGGLLAVQDTSTLNSQPSTHFCSYDGNGNLVALVNAADGMASADYEYGPFGEVIRASGPMAKANPVRFSSKYQDDETDLLYYGYRYYNASTGRWTSRDPIEERGGINVYALLSNDSLDFVDILGLAETTVGPMLKHAIPKSERACCDAATVGKGEAELNHRYNIAVARAQKLGVVPVSPFSSGSASCKNTSMDVLEFLLPTPKCWQCYLERRRKYSPAEDPRSGFFIRVDVSIFLWLLYSDYVKSWGCQSQY